MKLSTALLGLALVVSLAEPGRADEPHLQFIQGLRDRRYPDLAREYLEKLQANPPAELVTLLPLELAKTRLEMATAEPDAARKAALLVQAREEFEAFLKNNPGHPLAANANLEIARVIGFLGKSKLSEARRQETPALQKSTSVAARALFVEAATKLKDASTQIDVKLAAFPEIPVTPQDKTAKQALEQAKLDAEFERSMNLLDQAQTYMDDLLKRSDIIKEAANGFAKLSTKEPRNPQCWLARAYIGRCYQAIDQPDEANKYYAAVLSENGDWAESARRLVKYFQILMLHSDPKGPPFDKIRTDGEAWLQAYRRYQYTPEGFGIRFEIACACQDLAKKIPPGPDKKPIKKALDLYKQAETHFKVLADTENDYTARARQFRMNIILTTAMQSSGDDPDKLTKFEQCYIRAQYENFLIEDDQTKFDKYRSDLPAMLLEAQQAELKKRQEDLAASRKKRYQTILQCLDRALVLAATEPDVPEADVNDVRSMRAYVHLLVGNTYEAAILGEQMALTHPQSVRSSAAAGYALQAYAQIIARGETGMMGNDELEADRKCLRRLAEYIERTWPNDPATDFARHQMAALLLKDAVYPQAVEVLARISPSYGAISQARFQLALTALDLANDANKLGDLTREGLERTMPLVLGAAIGDSEGQAADAVLKLLAPQTAEVRKKYYHDKALEALESVPDATGSSDADMNYVFLLAKLRLGQMLFEIGKSSADEALKSEDPMVKARLQAQSDARFDQMEALGTNISKMADGLALSQQVRDEILPSVGALAMYAKYGKADAAFKLGDLAKVLTITDPVAADTKKALDDNTLGDDRFGAIRRGLLGLGLRANVQEGKTNRAKELLDLLQKSAAADPNNTGGATANLLQIIQELRDQIEQMAREGAQGARVQELKDSIANFLDALAQTKDLPPETTLFLASSYSNLDRNDKALELLEAAKIVNPGALAATPPRALNNAEENDPKKVEEFQKKQEEFQKAQQDHLRKEQVYRAFTLLRIRVLRQDANTFQGKERDDKLNKAKATMDELMAKEPWAAQNLEAIKEQIQIIEDMGAYGGMGGAIRRWDSLMKKMNVNNPREREQYFDCYYHIVYCFFKNGQKIPPGPQQAAMYKQAASLMLKLESSQPNMGADYIRKRYVELLKREPTLKEAYLAEKEAYVAQGAGKLTDDTPK